MNKMKRWILTLACILLPLALAVVAAAQETKCIVTVEEHSVIGGLGGAVSEIVAETGTAKVKRIGINDHFCGIGTSSYIMESEGLTSENIVRSMLDFHKK